ncbi:hypothetical protein [Ciceribacter sp. T2.26MG-112.2]|uniref:hypothetical protein n=1 Tax=Ciceribacter sp. T2.26MG-112.2 TaxID=3137154 RepID=UPI0012B6A3F4|nr:hypothetical protein [Ciceribacter naphthalenivorans]
MSDKLKRHLAEQGVNVLTPLLGTQFVELLQHLGQEALAPAVMAETIVTSRGRRQFSTIRVPSAYSLTI